MKSILPLALAVAVTFLLIEGTTLLMGHELTWFGQLSESSAAAVRKGLLALAVVLVALALYRMYRRRGRDRSTPGV